jgi:uncharacterized membrane protein YdjX (TVP38/TMEM64 family)
MTEKLGTSMTIEKPQTCNKSKSGIKRYLPLIVLLLAIAGAYLAGLHKYVSLNVVAENREILTAAVRDNLWLALGAYALIYTVSTALSLPGGALLTIVGGFLFGWLIGGLTTVIAATLGATVVFLIAKSSLGDFLTQKAGPFAKKLAEGFNTDAFNYLMFLRLVPVFPFWLINIAPALFNVRLRTYVITTFLGIIPGTFAIAVLGAGLGSVIDRQKAIFDTCVADKGLENCTFNVDAGALLTPQLLAAFAALGVVALIPVALKRWKAHTAGNTKNQS